MDSVEIIATRHFWYWHRTPAGEVDRCVVTTGTKDAFPKPVADRAIEKGAAAMPGTSEAATALRQVGGVDHITWVHSVSLGDPLGVCRSA